MSKPILMAVGFLLLGFVTGISAGLYMASASTGSGKAEKSTTGSSSGFFSSPEAKNQVEANTRLSNRIIELEKELAEQSQDRQTILADRMAFFKKYRKQIRVQPFDESLNVTPEMVELLGLSKEQQQTIEQHLAQVKVEMDKLEDGDTTVTKQTANSIALTISADPNGKPIKDELTGLLTADMGEAQADLFMNSDESSFARQFSGFADSKKEIELTWTQQNGLPFYTVKTSNFTPEGKPGGGTTLMSNGLPPEYQKYMPTDSAP